MSEHSRQTVIYAVFRRFYYSTSACICQHQNKKIKSPAENNRAKMSILSAGSSRITAEKISYLCPNSADSLKYIWFIKQLYYNISASICQHLNHLKKIKFQIIRFRHIEKYRVVRGLLSCFNKLELNACVLCGTHYHFHKQPVLHKMRA